MLYMINQIQIHRMVDQYKIYMHSSVILFNEILFSSLFLLDVFDHVQEFGRKMSVIRFWLNLFRHLWLSSGIKQIFKSCKLLAYPNYAVTIRLYSVLLFFFYPMRLTFIYVMFRVVGRAIAFWSSYTLTIKVHALNIIAKVTTFIMIIITPKKEKKTYYFNRSIGVEMKWYGFFDYINV